MRGDGCYAEGGPLAIHWRKISEGSRGITWSNFLLEIAALPDRQLWRHNQAGDLVPKLSNGAMIHETYLDCLVTANEGKRGFTYTHYPVLPPAAHPVICEWNQQMIKGANDDGFTINPSANNPAHADELLALEIGPVTTQLPSNTSTITTRTPGGAKIVVCPSTQNSQSTCETCALCSKYPRKSVVGFPAHGMRKGNIDRFIQIAEEANG